MRRPLAALLLALALPACTRPEASRSGDSPVDATPGGPAVPVDHPPVDPNLLAPARGTQRLTLEQLQRSFPVVLGKNLDGTPTTWMSGGREGFDTFAGALGEADFADTVVENLDPGPLYAKFMDDAARDACNRALTADAGRAQAQRVLLRFVGTRDTTASAPAAVDQNLRYLKLRFHGVRVPDGDAAALGGLRLLFTQSVRAAQGTATTPSDAHVREGWRTVCVALLTAPEFHLY